MVDKTEADYSAQLADAERNLAAIRAPKVEAALNSIAKLTPDVTALVAHRDGLHDGPTRQALVNVISVLTSSREIASAELAALSGARGDS